MCSESVPSQLYTDTVAKIRHFVKSNRRGIFALRYFLPGVADGVKRGYSENRNTDLNAENPIKKFQLKKKQDLMVTIEGNGKGQIISF
jgi:hypothetical protein